MNASTKKSTAPIFLFWSVPSISQIKEYKIKLAVLREANSLFRSVKVVTTKNETLEFKKIELEDGIFYGLRKIKGELKKIVLNINFIKAVILL